MFIKFSLKKVVTKVLLARLSRVKVFSITYTPGFIILIYKVFKLYKKVPKFFYYRTT